MNRIRAWLVLCGLFLFAPGAFAQFFYVTNGAGIWLESYTGTSSTVTVSNFVTIIYGSAFESPTAARYMTNLIIPNSVTNIQGSAFQSCTNLRTVTLGNSVIYMGADVFTYCYNLGSIALPSTLTSIGNQPFYEDTNLTSITVANGNPAYSSAGGVLFDAAQDTLVQYPGGLAGSYTIPSTVNTIGFAALWNCVNLTSITIPATLTNTGGGPLSGCTRLTNITVLPGNPACSSVGGVLFDAAQQNLIQYPGGLAGSYTIPNGVTGIGGNAFSYSGGLTNLIVPLSLTSIAGYAFQECFGLTNVLFEGNAPINLGTYPFFYDTNTTFYYLPGTGGWSGFSAWPITLWNPTFQTVQANPASFAITGTANIPIVLEASANLAGGVWTPLQACALTNGSMSFTDLASTSYSNRFYRFCFP